MTRDTRFLSLLAGLALLSQPVLAQEKEGAEVSGGATVAAQAGNGLDDSSKLQQYETIPEGVFLPEAWFNWKNTDGVMLSFKGTKLGLDDQFANLKIGKKNAFLLNLNWDQNPNWQSNTARTPYTQVSPGVFTVPDGMQSALQAIYVPFTGSAPANPTVANFYAVEPWVANGFPLDLRYLRRTGKSELSFDPSDNLKVTLAYGRELREGNKNTTFYGGPAYEIATPIDYATDDFRATADFSKGRVFANVSANFNKFKNDIPFVTIDNPERLTITNPTTGVNVVNDGPLFRLWMPPDNDAYTVDVTGGINLGRSHKLTASGQIGSMTMDMGLLPLSANSNVTSTASPLFSLTPPYSDVSAQFDDTMGQVKLTGDPFKKIGYIVQWRRFEMKDKTDEYHFNSTVRGDVGASYNTTGFTREAEGYSIESLKGELHATPIRGLRLAATFGRDKKEYDAREYLDVDDDVIMLSGDYLWDWAQFHLAWSELDRKPGEENIDAIQPTWQGATQQDIVERKRHNLSAIVTLTPVQKVAVSLTGQTQTNDFAESVTGLLDQSFDSFGADITFTPTEKVMVSAGYVYEKFMFEMAAAYIPRGQSPPYDPANLWANTTEDKIDTFRAAVRLTPSTTFDIDASFDYSKPRSDSLYDFALPGTPIGGLNEANGIFPANVPPIPGFPATTYDRFPAVSKEFVIAKVRFTYHVDEHLSASALYWHQKYDNIDWQSNQMQPYMGRVDPGANRWFFLGASQPSYDANILRAELTYRF